MSGPTVRCRFADTIANNKDICVTYLWLMWIIIYHCTHALYRQDLSCIYLAHCELENVKIIITVMMIINIVVVIAVLIIIVIHKTLLTILCVADKMRTSLPLGINQ